MDFIAETLPILFWAGLPEIPPEEMHLDALVGVLEVVYIETGEIPEEDVPWTTGERWGEEWWVAVCRVGGIPVRIGSCVKGDEMGFIICPALDIQFFDFTGAVTDNIKARLEAPRTDARTMDPHAEMVQARIKGARVMTGMSPSQVPQFSGGRISEETVISLERGDRLPTPEEYQILEETYDVAAVMTNRKPLGNEKLLLLDGLDGLAGDDVGKIADQYAVKGSDQSDPKG